jgi:hypothetical protein
LFGNQWNEREWRALGWRNFHYKSKFSKISFNPLLSTWILHFPNKPERSVVLRFPLPLSPLNEYYIHWLFSWVKNKQFDLTIPSNQNLT